MSKKTSILLEANHQRAIIKVMDNRDCIESKAIKYLLDRGIEADKLRKTTEVLQLKMFFYLRQIAGTRGQEFIDQIENDFSEVEEDMIEALHKGYSHVGK